MPSFTSSFSDHLQTNYVPDEGERAQIVQILAQPLAESRKLEADISSIEESLKACLQQRQNLQYVIDQHERLLSPFRRLTDDIVREIFLQCLPQEHHAIMSIHEAPFVLCLVCSRWKYVAYHTPRLWSTIHIPLPLYPTPHSPGVVEYEDSQKAILKFDATILRHCESIRAWISRSGTCPLSISFHPAPAYPIQTKTHLKPYLETLLTFSTRWHNLELTVLTGEFSTFFASIPSSAVPILETLNISFIQHWQDWGQPHDPTWNKSGLINPPSLRKLYFYHFPFPPSQLEVDWSRLTRLEIPDPRIPWQDKGLTLNETYTLFKHCQNLIYCSIDVEDTADAIYLLDPICLPHLESLNILDASHALGTLLYAIDLPALHTVQFQSLFKPSNLRRSPLITLLSRTQSTNVQSLITNLQMLTSEDFLEMVRLTPSLRTFSSEPCCRGPSDEQSIWIRGALDFPVDFVTACLNVLTPDSDHGLCHWPQLTHLDLGKVRRLGDDHVLKFVEKRMEAAQTHAQNTSEGGVAMLKSVKINFYRDIMDDIRPALMKYIDVEGGLKLDLVYPSSRVAIPGSIRPRKALFKRSSVFQP